MTVRGFHAEARHPQTALRGLLLEDLCTESLEVVLFCWSEVFWSLRRFSYWLLSSSPPSRSGSFSKTASAGSDQWGSKTTSRSTQIDFWRLLSRWLPCRCQKHGFASSHLLQSSLLPGVSSHARCIYSISVFAFLLVCSDVHKSPLPRHHIYSSPKHVRSKRLIFRLVEPGRLPRNIKQMLAFLSAPSLDEATHPSPQLRFCLIDLFSRQDPLRMWPIAWDHCRRASLGASRRCASLPDTFLCTETMHCSTAWRRIWSSQAALSLVAWDWPLCNGIAWKAEALLTPESATARTRSHPASGWL